MKIILSRIKTWLVKHAAIKIAAIYIIFAALWILLSDEIVFAFVKDPEFLTRIQIYKGMLFILITGLLIYALLHREIIRYKKVEKTLKDSENKFREMADMLPQIIFELDANGKFEYSNQCGFKTVGFTMDDIKRGLYVSDLVVPEEREKMAAALSNVSKGTPSWGIEFTSLRMDGSTFPILIFAQPIIRNNITIGSRGIAIDITERKLMEEQLRQAQKLETIGTMAAGIAHDFNNFLSPIIGRTELMTMKMPVDSPLYKGLLQIQNAAEKARNLANQLLAFGRKQNLDIKVINLNQVLTELKHMLNHTIRDNIELVTHLDCLPCYIRADATQIEQVIMNLVVNARDAMPNEGKITIETGIVKIEQEYSNKHPEFQPGLQVLLTISDTGKGMDNDTIKHVYEPFYTTKAPGRGTGLGLAIVHGIVKQHGGNIIVESVPDKGTTFKIYFPLVSEMPADTLRSPTHETAAH